ncbi:MAG: ABC transporter permease [Planctomycetes bacterium]|nr:ABC transporter permease [Planctomycetota bacterium]
MLGPALSIVAGVALLLVQERLPGALRSVVAPLAVALVGGALWSLAVTWSGTFTFPSPGDTARGLAELVRSQRLWGDIIASLFRVSWGFSLAAGIGIPLGLVAGWNTRTFTALNPVIQGLRPISPIAWIPIAILWFGIGDGAGIFLIFLSAFFPITVGTMAAVRNISLVHQRSAQNFGLRGLELFRRVVLPASMPQIITSLRIALGVAWLVIVAAEMVGMDSGLGYLINDARNAGSRYDLVVATMIVIGLIGIVLDFLVRQLERFDEVRWGYVKR